MNNPVVLRKQVARFRINPHAPPVVGAQFIDGKVPGQAQSLPCGRLVDQPNRNRFQRNTTVAKGDLAVNPAERFLNNQRFGNGQSQVVGGRGNGFFGRQAGRSPINQFGRPGHRPIADIDNAAVAGNIDIQTAAEQFQTIHPLAQIDMGDAVMLAGILIRNNQIGQVITA